MNNQCTGFFNARNRKRRLFMILTCVLVLCAGLALAVGETGADTDVCARAEALNEQLGRLLNRSYPQLKGIDPNINAYVFAAGAFTQEEYEALSARIAAVEEAHFRDAQGNLLTGVDAGEEGLTALWNLVRSLDLKIPEQPDSVVLFVDKVLKETGYTGYMNRAYRFFHWSNDKGEYQKGWEVIASNGEPAMPDLSTKGENIYLTVIGDDKIYEFYENEHHQRAKVDRALTPEERQMVRDRAVAFYEAYSYNHGEKADIVMISDISFYQRLMQSKKPFASVWIYAPAAYSYNLPSALAPYDEVDHDNLGIRIDIELETGRILYVLGWWKEINFTWDANAVTDWNEQTGIPWPPSSEWEKDRNGFG